MEQMISNAARTPSHVNQRAYATLNSYHCGQIKPCRIKCGNLSLKVGRKWRLLSRDNGKCWEVMSHEKYNQRKDRR
ncbi:ParE family toxin-like protein [Klebsiella oxytoca]